MTKRLFLLIAGLLIWLGAAAQPFLKLPALIDDGMVLQAGETVTLWGWTDPNTPVTVETSWGEKALAKSDFSSLWKVRIKTPAASFDAHSITISTRRKMSVTIKDVLIGQVWLCTGQSNMNWSAASGIKDALEATRKPNPALRLFTVPRKGSAYPQEDIKGCWSPCDSASARVFSAVGFFFGSRLAEELKQPVGLINASWGGTPVEVWMRPKLIEMDPSLKAGWTASQYSRREGWAPGCAYNGMIAPLTRFAAAGAIWYQGESNRGNAELYAREFAMMIEDWRLAFGRELPFYFVQIAPKDYKGGDPQGALVREQQQYVALTVPKTGIVDISDHVEDVTDIHPKYKKPVGDRLAAYALAEVYGKPVGKYKSPRYASMEIKKNRVVVSFTEAEGGLVCRGNEIEALEIGDGASFYPAQGILQGDKLVVWSNQVRKPVAVRYAFGLNPGNLADSAGNPVLPFRSDNPLLSASKPAPAADKAAPAAVQVGCEGGQVRTLKNGTPFFTNRKYPAVNVPASISGMQMVSIAGGSDVEHVVRITCPQGGLVRVLARDNKRSAPALEGWELHPDVSVTYTTNDPQKPGMVLLWTRKFRKGESVTLRGNDFCGFTVLAPSIELK